MALKLQDVNMIGERTPKTPTTTPTPNNDDEEARRAEEERQRRIKAQQEYLEKIKEASLYMAAYCKHLEELGEIVKNNFTGNTASQIEAEIQGMYATCQTVLNGLNGIGNDTAEKIKSEGGVGEYNNTAIPSEDVLAIDANQTFSCNTDILRLYVLPEIQNITENLTKMSSAIGELNVPEGCQGVGQIPSTLSSATQQSSNAYGQVAQFVNEVEKAEEENLDLIKKIGQGLSNVFGKFFNKEPKKTKETETGETELPKLKMAFDLYEEQDPLSALRPNDYFSLRDKLRNFDGFTGELPKLKPDKGKDYDPEDPTEGIAYDCEFANGYDANDYPEKTLWDANGPIYYENNGKLIKETFCQDSLLHADDRFYYTIALGQDEGYWVREDGVQMIGEYVMYAANIEGLGGQYKKTAQYNRADDWCGSSGPGKLVGFCEASHWVAEGIGKKEYTDPVTKQVADEWFDTYTSWWDGGKNEHNYYQKKEEYSTRNVMNNPPAETSERDYLTNEEWKKFFYRKPESLPEGITIDQVKEIDWEEYYKDPKRVD